MAKVEAETTIYQAFVLAQQEFNKASKEAFNPQFKNRYADLGNVLDAVTPALHKHGLALLQVTHEQVGGVCVETLILHTSGSQLSGGKFFVPASKQDPQGYGSALTYARRYSIMTVLGVATEDDDGHTATQANRQQQPQQQAKPAQQAQPVAQPAHLSQKEVYRKWIGDIVQSGTYSTWTAETVTTLLGGKLTKDASEQELKALAKTIEALPNGGGIFEKYAELKGATA